MEHEESVDEFVPNTRKYRVEVSSSEYTSVLLCNIFFR